MKKMSKAVVIVLTVVMIMVAVGALAGCEKNVNGYKFVVKDSNGNLLEGITVQLCLNTCTDKETDSKGVAIFEVQEGVFELAEYEVHLYDAEGETLSYSCKGVADGENLTTAAKAAKYELIVK